LDITNESVKKNDVHKWHNVSPMSSVNKHSIVIGNLQMGICLKMSVVKQYFSYTYKGI